jgi:glycosyltransferase involved in cell wall biosynthesis
MAIIVHVVESFGAGTLSMVSAIVNRQVKDGHTVSLVHSVREETPANWRKLFDKRVATCQVAMTRAISPRQDWQCAQALLKILRERRPHIVHLHSSKAGALGRILSLIYRGPRWYFSPHGLSFLQKAAGRVKNALFLLIEKLLARIPVTFIACSPSEEEQIRRHLSARVALVPNAVDFAMIKAAPGNGGVLRIGTVGRVTTARNPELFAAVALRLQREGIEFLWIGGGDESGEKALAAAGVKLTGWVDRDAALRHLASLDIYIQTSRWEGLPVAVIEAMGAGLPVIATRVVGNRDLVRDGENGWLVAEDAAAFAAALAPLIADQALRRKLGAQACAYVQRDFGVDRMMAALYRVYGI